RLCLGGVLFSSAYDWRSKTHGFEDMAIMRSAGYNLTGVRNELPESVRAAAASSNLFSLLGVQPALGRDFTEADESARQRSRDVDLERVREAVRRRPEDCGRPDSP